MTGISTALDLLLNLVAGPDPEAQDVVSVATVPAPEPPKPEPDFAAMTIELDCTDEEWAAFLARVERRELARR